VIAGTLAEPDKTFGVYFVKMKTAAEAFRKWIGCSPHCSQTLVD